MSGRHRAPRRQPLLRWLAGVSALALAALTVVSSQPAGAAPSTVTAQLSLSGVATASSPTGGTVIGIHPGDSVTFSAAAIPTAGFPTALAPVLAGALTTLLPYQVSADFSHLPGGAANTVLRDTATKTVTFPAKGTYDFTWIAQRVTVLGAFPIPLDGNALAGLGVTVNGTFTYTGQVVVATDPPAGGIGIQLPGVSVAPSLPVVGQLPTVGIPGITTPTLPGLPGLPGSAGGTPPTAGLPYTPPGLTVPEMVVPKGDGTVIGPDLNAVANLSLAGVGDSLRGTSGTRASGSAPSTTSATGGVDAVPAGHTVGEHPVQIAANPMAPSGQMPVVLAIAAIIVLSLVTAAYARLYLLRRPQ